MRKERHFLQEVLLGSGIKKNWGSKNENKKKTTGAVKTSKQTSKKLGQ